MTRFGISRGTELVLFRSSGLCSFPYRQSPVWMKSGKFIRFTSRACVSLLHHREYCSNTINEYIRRSCLTWENETRVFPRCPAWVRSTRALWNSAVTAHQPDMKAQSLETRPPRQIDIIFQYSMITWQRSLPIAVEVNGKDNNINLPVPMNPSSLQQIVGKPKVIIPWRRRIVWYSGTPLVGWLLRQHYNS